MVRLPERIAAAVLFSLLLMLSGCSLSEGTVQKVSDVDFTVVASEQVPAEFKDIIEERKTEEFRLVYMSGENMYISVGYGEQKTSGYSIVVDDLYLSSKYIYVDTDLIGPSKGETVTKEATYPYIVIMIENMDYPVMFE